VLGEGGHDPASIRTVHARGYQFTGEIQLNGKPQPLRSSELGELSPDRFLHDEMDSIRASLERVTHSGARAVLVHCPVSETRSDFFASAGCLLLERGYRICRVPEGVRAETPELRFFDRVLAGLVETHGIDALRSKLPIRAHELFERGGATSGARQLWPSSPLAARQYQGRILRSTADLLKALACECPLALVLDRDEIRAQECAEALPALLSLLGPSPVFILAMMASGDAAKAQHRGGSPPEAAIDEIEISSEGVDRLNVFLAARGIDALPALLADALIAHVRHDSASLETIVRWLRLERRADSEEEGADAEASTVRGSPMRRVEPGDSERRSGVGR
jgi:hypothetical protein